MDSRLRSRKFWMAIATAAFIVLTDALGVDLDAQTYWTLVGVAGTYILGQAWVDAKK